MYAKMQIIKQSFNSFNFLKVGVLKFFNFLKIFIPGHIRRNGLLAETEIS